MKIGFGKVDITPRVGVELCGFGPFIHRYSIAVRDRLFARAMAMQDGSTTLVLVSCDLIGVVRETTHVIREMVHQATGLPPEAIMVHCTHTHSGPNTVPDLGGWGELDAPYMALLPGRIAKACIDAVANLQNATISHAQVPCQGIALNREYDQDAPPLEDVLKDDWRPAKPEYTDTVCHVLKVESEGKLLGFASYYGCHPVVCCTATRYIHGDYAGVATNLLEREHPGSVGLFLQGALGDVNSCVVHKPEQESLLALDVIAARYANAVRQGLRSGQALSDATLRCTLRETSFARIKTTRPDLLKMLGEHEAILNAPGASDTDHNFRMACVYVLALRRLLASMDAGQPLDRPSEIQAFRLGPIALLGAPFEIFQAIKNETQGKARSSVTLVMGLTNDELGYATDRTVAARGGYAAQQVPYMLGRAPFARIHDELVEQLVALEATLH